MSNELPDLNIYDLIEIMTFMVADPPVTAALDRWGTVAKDQKGHMLGWCSAQPTKGKGAYSRSKANESTRAMYNRFLNPGGLLWLAEVLGEAEGTLRRAVDAAIEAEKVNYRTRCTAFRKVIPFERILELLDCPENWLIDERVRPLLYWDDSTGQPFLKEECEDEMRVLLKDYMRQ